MLMLIIEKGSCGGGRGRVLVLWKGSSGAPWARTGDRRAVTNSDIYYVYYVCLDFKYHSPLSRTFLAAAVTIIHYGEGA